MPVNSEAESETDRIITHTRQGKSKYLTYRRKRYDFRGNLSVR